MQELHNELIVHASEGGLEEAKKCVTGEVIISDTMLINIMRVQIRRMRDHNKQMCGYDYCNTATSMKSSLHTWRKKLKTLTKGLE